MLNKIFLLCAILFASVSAWANACTTSSSGNFQAVTWASCGSTYPHQADSFTISGGGVVHIPNGEVDQAGADPANGTTLNVTVTGTGSQLIVDNGGQFESHSSILITTHGNLTLGTGTALTWATTNVGAPIYSLQFQGNTLPYASLTQTGTNTASVGFNTATLSTIDVAAVNPTAYWNMTSNGFRSTEAVSWALWQHCGTKTTVHVSCAKVIGAITVNHLLLNLSAGIWRTAGIAGDDNFQYLHVRNTQDEGGSNTNSMLWLNNTAAQGGDIRQLLHSTFYNPNVPAGDASVLIQEAGTSISDVVDLSSFNIVNSASATPDLVSVNGLALGNVSTTDGNPYTVTSPGTGVSMSRIIVGESCRSNGVANVLRENNINTGNANAVSNRYTDWMVFGATRAGCNTNNGNWGGYVVDTGDSFPSGATLSTAGSIIKQFGVFHTAGALLQQSFTGTGSVNPYAKIQNALIYDNITSGGGNQQINVQGGATVSANKLLELSTIWMDNSNGGISYGVGATYVPQTTLTWENNNLSNPIAPGGNYLQAWNANANIKGMPCYANTTPLACYTQDGTATVSSVASGPPCVLTISGLTGAVNVGDFAFKTSSAALTVTGVSGLNITLGFDTSGAQSCGSMVATNTVLFGKSLWASTTNYYGQAATTGFGASDSALQPNFGNPTATLYAWSTMRGGAGTLDDARNRWATYVDGIPLDGDNCPSGAAPAPYCPAQTPGDSWQDFAAWAHWSFTIYNGRAAHSGYQGIDPGVNGVYNATVI